ncbi:MAG: transcriptional repressor [Oscillatoriales cyanobacterium]|nr:MAG: transcriptional repressor [Oscillatoriales cyanobacterium]
MKSKRPRSHDRILGLLNTQPQALSAQEIFIELRQRNQSLGLATIYRALDALKLAGLLQVRTQANGEALYSSAHQDRHHLTCLQCGDSIALDRCPIHDLEQQLQHTHQFKIYYHTLEFFGLCDQCAIAEPNLKPKIDPNPLHPS